jgi:hypothetical protein
MKLTTISMVAAIGQLLAVIMRIATWISGLASDHSEIFKSLEGYVIPSAIWLFAGITLTVFLFVLATRQQQS